MNSLAQPLNLDSSEDYVSLIESTLKNIVSAKLIVVGYRRNMTSSLPLPRHKGIHETAQALNVWPGDDALDKAIVTAVHAAACVLANQKFSSSELSVSAADLARGYIEVITEMADEELWSSALAAIYPILGLAIEYRLFEKGLSGFGSGLLHIADLETAFIYKTMIRASAMALKRCMELMPL